MLCQVLSAISIEDMPTALITFQVFSEFQSTGIFSYHYYYHSCCYNASILLFILLALVQVSVNMWFFVWDNLMSKKKQMQQVK